MKKRVKVRIWSLRFNWENRNLIVFKFDNPDGIFPDLAFTSGNNGYHYPYSSVEDVCDCIGDWVTNCGEV